MHVVRTDGVSDMTMAVHDHERKDSGAIVLAGRLSAGRRLGCTLHEGMQYAFTMAMIQIRGVSAEAHRRLKARAALEGKSLSEYLRVEIEHLASLPSLDEVLERVATREPVGGESATQALRSGRKSRGVA